MTRLLYDGTFEGMLTAVFEIYDHKFINVNLQKEGSYNGAMFENVVTITTDDVRASRVLEGLKKKLSPNSIQRLYIAHLAGIENEDNTILGYVRYAFDASRDIEDDYSNKYVLKVSEIVGMMRREKHRMEAFVRFKKLKDDTFYAAIEPDFNVLPLLIRHFKGRYADQKWIIYDIRRKYGLSYDLHDAEFISIEFYAGSEPSNLGSALTEDEGVYQHLWKNYFTSVNIQSRKNTRLHIRHIPKRYWKHLTEKI
jgi:probable DNA metabolism protein